MRAPELEVALVQMGSSEAQGPGNLILVVGSERGACCAQEVGTCVNVHVGVYLGSVMWNLV